MVFSNFAIAQMNKAEVIATGLTCSMCSNAIYKQLQKSPGVEKVETNLNTNTFTVFYKKNNQTKPIDIKDNIEKSGFFIGSLLVYLPSESLKINSKTTLEQDQTSFEVLDGNAKISTNETKLKVFDEGYITAKELKKQRKIYLKKASFSNSVANVYHVKLAE